MVRLGPYELQDEIGRGGMGSVFRARSVDGKTVAVKLLLRLDGDKRDRFERERRLLGELSSAEGFVPLLDAGDSPRGPYIVMPFLGGGTLRSKLERGALAVDDAVALVSTLARTIGRAHERGIVHRDLKPDNVLFGEDGSPLIADLGLAKHFDRSSTDGGAAGLSLSKSREARGTFAYMAPEQLVNSKAVGPPADVFALGAILYECLTGQPAFFGETVLEVTGRIASGDYTPVRRHRAETPGWLVRVLARALGKEAEDRFEDGAAFAERLDAGPDGERGRRWRFAAAGVALVLGGLGAFRAASALSAAEAPVVPVETAVAPVATRPAASEHDWFQALRKDQRPAPPFPRGLVLGRAPGEYVNEKDGSILVYVVEGGCMLGDPSRGGVDERPRQVTLSAHWIGKYEVTVRQFEAFVAATGYRTRAEKEGMGGLRDSRAVPDQVEGVSWRQPRLGAPPPSPDHPVTQVTRDDANAYVQWAGLRLSTEAEWEQAARWDPTKNTMRTFPWGDALPTRELFANLADVSFKRALKTGAEIYEGYDDGFAFAAPIGSFPLGVSPLGVHDLGGNVAEWVADGYDGLATHLAGRDPFISPATFVGIARGGSYATKRGWAFGWHRHREEASTNSDDLGFRVARGWR